MNGWIRAGVVAAILYCAGCLAFYEHEINAQQDLSSRLYREYDALNKEKSEMRIRLLDMGVPNVRTSPKYMALQNKTDHFYENLNGPNPKRFASEAFTYGLCAFGLYAAVGIVLLGRRTTKAT